MIKTVDETDAQEWVRSAKAGDFAEAWKVSDRILERHQAQPDFARPRHKQSVWNGEPLDGKRVLIRCYHGLGDTIQFIRFAPLVRAIAREVIVWAPAQILPLIAPVPGIDRTRPLHDGAPEADYDVDVEVMELPFVFRTTLDTIPHSVPYLSVPPADLPGDRPRIGLVWRCGDWEHHRSVSFEIVKPLLDVDGVTWCSFQLGRRAHETHPRLLDLAEPDLYSTARGVAALDLMITIDSMLAHLAGALAIPVWTLLLEDADWRWLQARDNSPWYPTMRLYRQQREDGWEGVVRRVRDALITEPQLAGSERSE